MSRELNIKDNGVEMIRYEPNLKQSVQVAAKLWAEYCALSELEKRELAMDDAHSGFGYELKDGSGIHGDRKENFDFTHKGYESLLESTNNTTAQKFIRAADNLSGQIKPMIQTFGKRVDSALARKGFEQVAAQNENNTFFRFLHYPAGTEIGSIVAEPHVDHSGFTFHLYESTGGCEYLTQRRHWQPLPVESGEAVSFGGMQTQLATNGGIEALCHRVVANQKSSRDGRIAIVCFVALANMPTYNRSLHGRLQEKRPGFNYGIDNNKFRELFL